MSVFHQTGRDYAYSRLQTGTLTIVSALEMAVYYYFLSIFRKNNFCTCLIKTSAWISDTPSVLEEYMQCVTKPEDLKILLRCKANRDKMVKMENNGESACLENQPGWYLHATAEHLSNQLIQLMSNIGISITDHLQICSNLLLFPGYLGNLSL